MSYQRLYYSAAECAVATKKTITWPAFSIGFLCVFSVFAPVSLLTAMNFYLLLLVAIGWVATRHPIERPLMWLLLPFVLAILIGLTGGISNTRYLYLKDAWYFSNPAVILAIGYLLARILNDTRRGLRAFVIGGTLVSLYHLSTFVLHPELLLRQATLVRSVAGTGYYSAAVAVILLLGWHKNWRDALGLSPGIASLCILVCTASVALSFSRTMLITVILGALAMVGFFSRKEGLRIGGLALATFIGLTLLETTVDTTSIQAKNTFVGKMARAMDEINVQEYSTAAEINTNWRGFETARAIATWQEGSPAQIIFGKGFGAQVDLGFFQKLSKGLGGDVRFIPILHNGYMYLLVKTGLAGVLLYVAALVGLYVVGRRHAQRDDTHGLTARALQACSVILLVSTWVVAGAFNKFDMFSLLLLTGFLLATVAQPKTPPTP